MSDSDQLQVTFEAIHKGYFLGGDMWRGRLNVGPGIAPGEYSLSVLPRRTLSARKAPAFRILVLPSALSLQKSSTSLIRRWFGFSAFSVSAGCLPGILLAFGAVYWLSGKREAWLAASGRAEVYRVTRGDDGCEIRFALGTAHGISPGAGVAIYDAEGRQVGTGTVEASNQKVSVAQVTSGQEIRWDTWCPASDVRSFGKLMWKRLSLRTRILVLLIALVITTIGGGLVTLGTMSPWTRS